MSHSQFPFTTALTGSMGLPPLRYSMRELQNAVQRLAVILQSSPDSGETESRDEPAALSTDDSLRYSMDEESLAWQSGYQCFETQDYAKGDTFLKVLDGIPEQFHKAAFARWTAAMSDHNAFRKD
jgi:hypothetical protein